jgi:hypothetical protein
MGLGMLFLKTFYFGTPAVFAALLHGFVMKYDWFKFLKGPMDCGVRFRGKPLFGPNKTWRGLIVSAAGTVIFAFVHAMLYHHAHFLSVTIVDYAIVSPLLIGLAMGVGMILGELPNSFLKRQLGIGAGQQESGFLGFVFRLYDQIDLLIGVWGLMLLVPGFSVVAHLDVVIFSIFMTLVLHILVAQIGYALGMRKSRF